MGDQHMADSLARDGIQQGRQMGVVGRAGIDDRDRVSLSDQKRARPGEGEGPGVTGQDPPDAWRQPLDLSVQGREIADERDGWRAHAGWPGACVKTS